MSDLTLGRYLFERLKQLQVKTIFGLPGDFNLSLLDKIDEVEGMRWAGNANELNAAYAADGYARIKRISCLITTFGVGELSALNGIGGAYAEHVGIIHVVGVPSISSQAKSLLLNHTLGNGDFTVFHRMSNNISHTTAFLSDINTAPSEVDRCIKEAWIYQKPVYIGLPANLVDLKIPSNLLDIPLDLSLRPNDPDAQEEVIDNLLKVLKEARNPIILVDACCSRHNCKAETRALVEVTKFPVFTTPMGKGTIDEGRSSLQGELSDVLLESSGSVDLVASRFGGVYVGSLSHPEVKEFVDQADLILSIGALLSEFNTSSFYYGYKTKNIVEFHADYTKIKLATYPGVQMKEVLGELVKTLKSIVIDYIPRPVPRLDFSIPQYPSDLSISQEWLWTRLSSWFQEGDIIITETGTSAFGIIQSKFPNNTIGISQVLWGSVGYTVGATLGAVMAAEEIDASKRVILFVGDGSLQLTVQEISTMVKWNTKPYLFVINNQGYTIDRLIHGRNASYYDIQPWNNLDLLPLFNAKEYDAIRVSSVGEADALLNDQNFSRNTKIRMVEVMLPKMDAISNLKQANFSVEFPVDN